MLQSLRENLKGAVAVVVLLIFIVPLVLFGVEQLFVGSVGGTEAATVNGEDISVRELQREIQFDKMRMQQQYDLSPTDPKLDDSELRGPALDRLVRRMALYQAAKDGSMGAGKDALWQNIAAVEGFQVDGKFDYQLFKDRISNFYTPATYLDASAKDHVLGQLNKGLTESTFITEADVQLIASITQQQRSFYSVDIPKASVSDISVTEEEIKEYYESNSARYMEPEKATVEYIELSLDDIANQNPASEEEVKSAYEIEVSEFNADPKYQVAHILIEDDADSEKAVSEVSEKLAAGEAFETLAATYSDDLGSKEAGGNLGELVEDAFPSEFVDAAKSLAAGEVSAPVKTDAGTHFIKVLAIANAEPPKFDERKEALMKQLARQNAQEAYITKMAKMDELTFGVDNLEVAAAELGLQVNTSKAFTRGGGVGVAANREIVEATFAEDVLKQGQNSRVIEIAGDKAVVVRLKEHTEAALKPLETVKASIETQLKTQKTNSLLEAKADELQAELAAGSDPEALATENNYTYSLHEDVKRNNFEVSRALVTKAFSLARPQTDKPVYDKVKTAEGFSVVALVSVKDGEVGDLTEQEVSGIKGQLEYQIGQMEMTNFEQAVVAEAKIDASK